MSLQPTAETRTFRNGLFQVPLLWAGRGRPLLFLHDAWGPVGGWAADGFLARLAEDHLVLAPSHPGFNGATGLEHLDDIVDLALYYLDFLDELLIDSPFVVGHGLGGMIAAEMASLAPQRIAKLVLTAPYGLWLDGTPIADVSALSPDELGPALWHDPAAAPPLASTFAEELRLKENLAATAKFILPRPEKGLRKRIHRLVAPTLVVWGEQDRVVPLAYGELFRQKIVHSRLVVIPEAAHFPQFEQADVFSSAVLEFFES